MSTRSSGLTWPLRNRVEGGTAPLTVMLENRCEPLDRAIAGEERLEDIEPAADSFAGPAFALDGKSRRVTRLRRELHGTFIRPGDQTRADRRRKVEDPFHQSAEADPYHASHTSKRGEAAV